MKNAKMSEYKDDSYTINYAKGLKIISDEENEENGYKEKSGIVYHDSGIVHFNQYKQWPAKYNVPKFKALDLYVIHNGQKHNRRWQAWYGDKTITRLANEFIEEIKGKGS